MKKLKLTPSKILLVLLFAFIFAFMLYGNIKTPMLLDDYDYCFSFADGERIESVLQILPSMVAHRQTMNGRVIPHYFLQLCLMLPLSLFNLDNAAMFTALIAIICKLAFLGKDRPTAIKPITACAAFAAIWVYEPAFGETVLWKTGAVNYLWAAVVALLYVYICAQSFSANREPKGAAAKTAFLIFSFIAGAYSETCAITSIAVAFLLCAQAYFIKKRKPSKLMIASFVFAFAGFVFLVFAPAESAKLTESLTAERLIDNIKYILLFFGLSLPLLSFCLPLRPPQRQIRTLFALHTH